MSEFTANVELSAFALRLRRLRLDRGLSPSETARACGLQADAICRYELDKQTPSISSLTALANFFEVSTDYLLGRTDLRRLPDSNALSDMAKTALTMSNALTQLQHDLNRRDE